MQNTSSEYLCKHEVTLNNANILPHPGAHLGPRFLCGFGLDLMLSNSFNFKFGLRKRIIIEGVTLSLALLSGEP